MLVKELNLNAVKELNLNAGKEFNLNAVCRARSECWFKNSI